MAGLRNICRMYGGMKVSSNGKTINYVWDYAAEEPVDEKDMPFGSERHKASEIARAELMRKQIEYGANK